MKRSFIITYFVLPLLLSCSMPEKKIQNGKPITHVDTSIKKNAVEEQLSTIPENIKPVFGYRFVVSGDFDGDGKKEKLIEHFFSGLDKKETNKFYDGLSDYDQLVALTIKKEPFIFLNSDNALIDTFHISTIGQVLGLSYLKNEGDLNGDGTDEVSYVVNWADWSTLNTWHLATFKNGKWTELYTFPIWDWQIPDLPEDSNADELSGMQQKTTDTTNSFINKRPEKELKNFKGLIKKVKTNKIEIIFRNEEAEEDTMIVDLKQLK